MEELDLKELFEIFWNKKAQIILIILIFIVLGIIYTMGFTTPMYTSSTTLVLAGTSNGEQGEASGTITATMYYPSGGYHGALDYGVPVGTPVYAADTGVVLKTANLTSSYGTYVVIQHSGGLQTWYAHGTPGSICVSPGQTVSRGQQIMKSGNSGNSSGAHLHFEVRVAPYDYNTCRVDPRKYL